MHLLVLGLGYTAARFAAAFPGAVTAVRSRPGPDTLTLGDPALPGVIAAATHILSSVPPAASGDDPVLVAHGDAIAAAPARWVGYLSSTGVYGDAAGAWVDEAAPLNGRRSGRLAADEAWQALHPQARVFRLPGIYGPGRSALDRLRAGPVARIDLPGHVFSRVHVDDIVGAMLASLRRGAPGIYNLCDDEPAPGEAVTAFAAQLLGVAPAPLQTLDAAQLSPMGRAFYGECRRVANGKMTRDLGYDLRYPDYRDGLRACLGEMTS
ncbi:SDR family NAD(P)-dependent oxidoreductase [Polymorphobacter fuscus]|uniref:SDR family NAD(P)-dependent oxidoreductase n=1 Tax=Sandarakinorhabdus fusca TaxID=1439888 RepID=A0A7C9GQE1_9SPHN|nr:SDR family NAD(P)-dependent oxidoreductase [Polymorphobacter fuscus]KAB7646364.1 SDR family NAD(P)-dependent oxidoreductase [Polymorphobacter fuscus]MQT17593.1 SDR family NAD(P)-dependent oxidoreductase [Polymorphobacter fuscus]NJC09864.1 nucleoside-diphosphate-sugar epimerase [Polymorphobacter fuscus]